MPAAAEQQFSKNDMRSLIVYGVFVLYMSFLLNNVIK